MKRALALIVVTGCLPPRGPHVRLEAPPPDAPFEERKAAFGKLKALGVGGKKSGVFKTGTVRYLELGDYKQVYQPEDLLPVVRPESATAREIGKYRDAISSRRLKRNIAGIVLGASAALLAGGIVVSATSNDRKDSTGFFMIGLGVFGVMSGGMALYYPQMTRVKFENQKAVENAFKHYDESLAARLRVCVRGTELVDCDAR